ncbi:MAG: HprK-related kinase A [Halioglobus sp.]
MKVGDLGERELENALRLGLAIQIGGFDICVSTALPMVIHDLRRLYSNHEVSPADVLPDYHVTLRAPGGIRRWFRPQVNFFLDANSPFKPLPQNQGFAMFEWGLNWCVAANAHQFLNIHAAVVERGGRALILPGAPGSGKSTLCAALVCDGWRLLSDEMTLVGIDDGLVHPFPRPISLKNASIDVIREIAAETYIGTVVEDTAKGTVAHMRPPISSVAAGLQTAIPARIVFPRYNSGATAMELSGLGKGEAFLNLAENSFNYHVLGESGFEALSVLVEQCECFRLEYASLDEAIPAMENLLAL